MLRRYLPIAVLLFASLAGCGQQSSELDEESQIVSADQLASTLREIEKTGEFYSVLPGLSGGLEQAGFMNEAAEIQKFSELPAEKIKKLAGVIATHVENTQKTTP